MKEVENKFIVINIKDLEHLTEEGKEKLYTIIYAIEKARKMHNKKINNYWVCNQDEPYAEQVKNLILSDGEASQLEPLVMQKIIKAKIIKHSRRKLAWFDPFINQIIDVIHIGSKSYLDVGDWYIIAEDYHKYLMQPGSYHKGMRYINGNFLDFNNFSA